MSLSRASTGPTVANDNGVFAPTRVRAAGGIVKIAAQLAGRVSVRFVTDRVFIILGDHAGQQHAA